MASEKFTGLVLMTEDGEETIEPGDGGVMLEFGTDGALLQARYTVTHEDEQQTEYVVPAFYIKRAFRDIRVPEAAERVPVHLVEEPEAHQDGRRKETEYETV